MYSISKLEKNSNYLKIVWNDGEESRFNYLWLRDNCPTAHDKDSRHRMFNILSVSPNINPKNYNVGTNGSLEIEWSEGDHKSSYNPTWLRENCYTIKNKTEYISPYKLWNSSLQNNLKSIEINHDEIINSEEGLVKWLELLHNTGIAIVKNAPTEKNSAFKVLNRISHTRETFFKTPFEVINIPKPNNSAYTAHALRNHMDLPWFELPPGYQFLHCLVNDAEGGSSTAVDGFAVANFLKKYHSKKFELLSNNDVVFKDNDFTQKNIRIQKSPIIKTNKHNDIEEIRINLGAMGTLDIDPKIMNKFYDAYTLFYKQLHSKKFQIEFKLKAGDIFCFDNRRILHGRKEFDPNSGNRHLQGYYIEKEEIKSKLNYLNKIKF